jgi:hypothetical protein
MVIHNWCRAGSHRETLMWEMEWVRCLLDLPAYQVIVKLCVALGDQVSVEDEGRGLRPQRRHV